MGSRYKQTIRAVLRRFDIDIQRYSNVNEFARRRLLLESHHISLAIDVGANTGRYGLDLRSLGFGGRILSFEPVSEAYRKLERTARADRGWDCFQTAIGDVEGEVKINVAGNLESSSLLAMQPLHLDASPHTRYVSEETVLITSLDRILSKEILGDDRLLIKIDVQGYEREVLAGASECLKKCNLMEIEFSPVSLYEGQPLLSEFIPEVEALGFGLVGIKEIYVHPRTGQVLSVDALFSAL